MLASNVIQFPSQYSLANKIILSDCVEEEFREPVHQKVQPIQKDDIERIKNYLLSKVKTERYKKNNIAMRNYAFFTMGINTARRPGDLLDLVIGQVLNADGSFKKHIRLRESKTQKTATILLTPAIKDALYMYLVSRDKFKLTDYLFIGRQKRYLRDENKELILDDAGNPIEGPMTVDNMRSMVKDIAKALGFQYNVGAYSLRKTWVRNAIMNTPAKMPLIQKACNHSKEEITRGYAELNQDDLDELYYENQL